MPNLTVRNKETGEEVTFPWEGDRDPTPKEIDAIVKSVSRNKNTAGPDYMKQVIGSMSVPEKFLTGVGKGMADIGYGIAQKGLQAGKALGIVEPKTLETFQKSVDEERKLYKPLAEESTAANIGEIVGQTTLAFLLPGGIAGGMMRRAATSGLAGAAQGAAEYVPEGEGVLGNIAGGAAGGVLGSFGMAGLGKVANAIGGKIKPKYQELYNLSKQENVPLSAGDIMKSPNLQRTEVMNEYVPWVGMGKFRKTQGKGAKEAAERTMGQYGSGSMNEAQGRMTDALGRRLDKALQTTDKAYQALAVEVAKGGTTPVTLQETRGAVSSLLNEFPDVFDRLPDKGLKKKLDIIMRGSEEVIPGSTSPILTATGQAISTPSKTVTANVGFEDVDFVRKRLNNYLDRAYKSSGAMGSEETHALGAIKSALDKDLDMWATKNSTNTAVKSLYDRARKTYIDEVVPFREALFKRATADSFDPDTIFKTFVRPGREELAGKFADKMDPQGLADIKYALIKSAYDKAMPTGTAKEVFSPKTFSTELKKMNDVAGRIFSPNEMSQLEGLTKVMEAARRGGQYLENPPTGQRLMGVLGSMGGTGYFVGGVPGIAGEFGASALLTAATTTEAGKRFLLAASKMEPNSPGMKRVVEQLYKLAGRASAAATHKGAE